ncbi:MAG: carboxymuconolactone decarboxylase family protein [Gammaproteobacteria bacterium]|nr:carboxymuconolactone decarboxylase family protein [Gammaproteobacteria bacterium]
MSRLAHAEPADLPGEMKAVLDFAEQNMGFRPNDVLIMARWPELLQAMLPVVATVYSPGTVGMELKRMVGLVVSTAAGCQYCVAHNAHGLGEDGVTAERLESIWEFETSPLFTDAERAALRYARGAGQSPSRVTDDEFAELQAHFDDQQILEITGVIALFGFLNRWNAGLGVTLEDAPLNFAREHLDPARWNAGIHAPENQ